MRKNGLKVNSINGSFLIEKPSVAESINDFLPSELIIVGVKAWQVKELAPGIKNMLQSNTIILPLQNGILAANELNEHLPAGHVVGGLCRIISEIETPGVITHRGVEPIVVMGELNGGNSERLNRLKEIFEQSAFKAKVSEDINTELWKKLIGICISGLLAITKTTYGEVRNLPETRALMCRLFTEGYNVALKCGANLEPDFVEKTISFIDSIPFDMTTSLARDVWNGKPSEIEYQNGILVKLGEKFGLPVPVNTFIYHCILPMEQKARGLAKQ
jgi:2-dehydropantoate 2-reductase